MAEAMTDEAHKALALEYLKRLDRGEDFFELFAEHIQLHFPKIGIADGIDAVREAFAKVGSLLVGIKHDYAYFNYVVSGDHIGVEGANSGRYPSLGAS